MSKNLLTSQHVLFYKSDNFSIKVKQTQKTTSILMQLNIGIVNTRDLPHTFEFLNKQAPGVLKTECFNENMLPFSVEVKATELGHLFEHILLEEICNLKVDQGYQDAVYNGVTSWNWKKDPYGLFRIKVDTGKDEEPLFHVSLTKTIKMFEMLINSAFVNNNRALQLSVHKV